jgi:hypothetical protein
MTLHDLYKAVSQLGFEDSLGDDSTDRFIYATNRALIEINSLRPRRKRVDINHRVPENLLFSEPTVIEKNGGKDLVFTAVGAKSFYFEVCGEGQFTVGLKKKDGSIVSDRTGMTSFDSKTFISQRGFIKYDGAFIDTLLKKDSEYTGEAVITFTGDYDYVISNIAMYDRVYSSKEAEISPYGRRVGYDLSELANDFEKLDTPPIDFLGKHLYDGYGIEGSVLYLPLDRPGIYTVNYLHKVTLIPLESDITKDIIIDLEEDLESLLPNLIAAYVWLDDEAEKSQYYYTLYQQRAEQIKRITRDLNPIKFESVNGW